MTGVPEVIDIGGRLVGPGHPVFVIAELSANHSGDYERAADLVRERGGGRSRRGQAPDLHARHDDDLVRPSPTSSVPAREPSGRAALRTSTTRQRRPGSGTSR